MDKTIRAQSPPFLGRLKLPPTLRTRPRFTTWTIRNRRPTRERWSVVVNGYGVQSFVQVSANQKKATHSQHPLNPYTPYPNQPSTRSTRTKPTPNSEKPPETPTLPPPKAHTNKPPTSNLQPQTPQISSTQTSKLKQQSSNSKAQTKLKQQSSNPQSQPNITAPKPPQPNTPYNTGHRIFRRPVHHWCYIGTPCCTAYCRHVHAPTHA